MASWDDCIDQALQAGKVSRQVADILRNTNEKVDAINTMMASAKRQRREAAIQAVRIADAWAHASEHPDGAATGLMSLMVKDVTGKAGYANVDMRQKFYEHRYHAKLADFLNRYRTRMVGLSQDREGLNNLVAVLYGETPKGTPEELADLKELAKAYSDTLELARQDINRMGASIHKNDHYLMPQKHDARTIRKYSRDEWMADVAQWIDRDKMRDDFGNVLSPDDLQAGLEYAYESITTDGLNKAKDFTAPPRVSRKMARRGSEKRFLYFKDSASWLAYQNKYGRGDVFQTLISNINLIAHDAATMEIFGTNPKGSFDALMQMAEKSTLEKTGKQMPGRRKAMLEAVFKVTAGYVDQGHMTTMADFMQSTRNVITASRLGKAVLSAISDEGFTAVTANYNNLSLPRILSTKLQMLGDEDLKLFATKIGLGAESWTNAVNAGNRYGDVYMTGTTGKMAEVVMRASGLEPLTDAGRKAFTMEYSAALAENFGRSFDEVQEQFGRAFEAYGITREDWDVFRTTKPLEHKGAKYADMLGAGSEKFHQMIMSEVDYAIPTPDSRVRAITTGAFFGAGGQGTVSGQIARTMMNLKTFPITLLTTHLQRGLYQSTLGDKATYMGYMLAATTLMGALAMQAKDLASGREIRPMGDPGSEQFFDFWSAAMMQGGGLGIVGDYLFSDVNRFGGSPVATAFGPTGQIVEDALQLTVGNLQQAFNGKDTNWSSEAIQFIESNTPSIWQIQPIKNAMFDQMQILVDPKAQKKMALARRRRKKEYRQDYWWAPGEATPEALQN